MAAPAVPWSWKTRGFATAPWGRAQPVVFHDQSVGIAARRKTPKRSAHPSRLDENAFFLLTKKTPYKGWGEGRVGLTTSLIRRHRASKDGRLSTPYGATFSR